MDHCPGSERLVHLPESPDTEVAAPIRETKVHPGSRDAEPRRDSAIDGASGPLPGDRNALDGRQQYQLSQVRTIAEETDRSRINVARTDDVVARVKHDHEGGDGGHSGGERVPAGSALQRGQRRLKMVARWVAGARIVPAAVAAKTGEFKSRRKIDGHIDGARERVGALSGVDGKGRVLVWRHEVSRWLFAFNY